MARGSRAKHIYNSKCLKADGFEPFLEGQISKWHAAENVPNT